MTFEEICGVKEDCKTRALENTIQVAVEIAREGCEGRKIGTLFVVSDESEVLRRSKCLILDPLFGHPPEKKKICDPDVRETIKELAQLDGAFIVGSHGVVISAARYINASAKDIHLSMGLGSRHVAAASITRDTEAVAVVVSASSIIRIFNEGHMIAEIIPEVWLLSKESIKLAEPYRETTLDDLRIVTILEKGIAINPVP